MLLVLPGNKELSDQLAGLLALAPMGILLVIGLAGGVALTALYIFPLSQLLKRVPPEHRKMEPNMAWLLLTSAPVPCFSGAPRLFAVIRSWKAFVVPIFSSFS